MITSVLRHRVYRKLYLYRFLTEAAWSPTYVLIGAFLIQVGMPLWATLLFYGLEFGLRGFLSAWAPQIMSRLGVVRSILLANLCQAAFLVAMVLGAGTLWIPFAAMVLFSFSGAIYYPYSDVLEAAYVEDGHRGVQMALSSAVTGTASALGYTGFAWLVGIGSVGGALLAFGLLMPLSVLPLLTLDPSRFRLQPTTARDNFKYLNSEEFRPLVIPMLGEQLTIICHAVVIPLFIYHAVGNVQSFGFLMAATIIIQMLVCLALGRHTDRVGHHLSAWWIIGANAFSSLLFLFVPPTVKTLLGMESVNRIAHKAQSNNFNTFVHQTIVVRSQDMLRFGVAWQVVLCAGELVTLPLLALAAWKWGWPALNIGFCLNIIGAYLVMMPIFAAQRASKK